MKCDIFMKEALALAEKAKREGEVPVGAVVVKGDEIIGRGYNKRETLLSPLAHAEIEAIHEAAKTLGSWRLTDCDLYVTLEPCPMCAGAIINSRISRVFYGAYDNKAGSFGTLCDLTLFKYNSTPEIHGGILEDECKEILQSFFENLR